MPSNTLPPLLVTLVALLATGGLTWVVRDHERELVQATFAREAATTQSLVQRQIDREVEVVRSLAAVFDASDVVTRAEFGNFAYRSLTAHPEIRALEWIPRVEAEAADEWVDRAEREGVTGFRIVERDAQGDLVPAARRDEFFPVFFVEPKALNLPALGYDIGSEAVRRAAVERARDTGEPQATAPVQLVQLQATDPGLLVLVPVYAKGLPLTTPEERHFALQGFALGVFEVPRLVDHALGAYANGMVSMELYDQDDVEQAHPLLHSSQGTVPLPLATMLSAWPSPMDARLDLLGRTWNARFSPTRAFMATQHPELVGVVLLSGLLVSGLLGVYVLGSAARTGRVEGLARELRSANELLGQEAAERARAEARLRELNAALEDRVQVRTSELEQANEQLRDEVRSRRIAEAELALSRQHLAFLLASFPGVVWTTDRRGRLGSVAGAQAREVLPELGSGDPVPLAEVEGLAPVRRLLLDAHAEALSGVALSSTAELAQRVYDVRVEPAVLKDGPGSITVLLDVTERHRLEAELVRSRLQEMQRLENLAVLAGGVAHHFNNLLVGVLGNASLLQELLGPDSPHARPVAEIVESAQQAADLTRQLLAYAGHGAIESRPLDLSELVQPVGRLLRASMAGRAELVVEPSPALPPVQGDSLQLQQVMVNLVSNAVEAMEGQSGKVRLRTGLASIDSDRIERAVLGPGCPPGDYVILEVVDEGCGMDEEQLRRAFEPFFTTRQQGRGLGLSAVFGITRAHRGAIELDSEPGHGTTVRVLLPAQEVRPASEPQRPHLAPPANRRGSAVLVVDDERAVRELVIAVVKQEGRPYLAARDGAEALALFASHAPHIGAVVLDLSMPGMNGRQVLAAIREIDGDVPVILSSGYSKEEALGGLDAHGCHFLAKPYRVTDLQRALAVALTPVATSGDGA